MRITLADAKAESSGLAAVANLSPDDPRFVAMLNRAIQNLVQTGEMFFGLYENLQFCVTSGCVVWPRQVAAIETIAVCGNPIPIRNQWFEYLGTGLGLQSGRCGDNSNHGRGCASGLIDRGTTCSFSSIRGASKKIKVYADVPEDGADTVLLQGYDQNNNWIRTQVEGVWIDGEKVGISTTPQTSYNIFSSLVAVQKPQTNGVVRLYEYDTVLTTQRAIAVYEPTETNPSYRKQFIPGITTAGCPTCDGDTDNTSTQVTVMAKMEYLPVAVDSDWLLISSLPALEAEFQAIAKLRNNLFQDSLEWHAKAIDILRKQLRHYQGHGVVAPIRMAPRNVSGPGVFNIV